jgi:hypothetical protein
MDPSRRRLITGVAAGATVLGLGALNKRAFDRMNPNTSGVSGNLRNPENGPDVIDDTFAYKYEKETTDTKVVTTMGDLEGMGCADILTYMFGCTGNIGHVQTIDFAQNLRDAWDKKVSRHDISGAAAANKDKLVEGYVRERKHRMTIAQYAENIDIVLEKLYNDFDFDAYGKYFNLSTTKINTAKVLLGRLKAKHLIAYGLTELMPGAPVNAKGTEPVPRNIKILDFVLRTAGPEFLDQFPAINDEFLSIGTYQFTSMGGIRDDDDATLGASVSNNFVYTEKNSIPGSVYKLRGATHHRAAWLLAATHIAKTLKNIDDARCPTIINKFANPVQYVGYLGACHNQSASVNDFARWIQLGAAGPVAFVRKSPKLARRVTEHYIKSTWNSHALEHFGYVGYDHRTIMEQAKKKDIQTGERK